MEDKVFTVEECENIVKTCLKGKNVQTLNIEVANLPNENFIINVTVTDGTENKILSFFVKSSTKTPQIQQILFDEFKSTVPDFDPKITPKLYCSQSNLLFFEDLTWQGFQNVNAELGFDLNHVEVALKTLAKFHSGSLAYEEIKTKEMGVCFTLDQKYKVENIVINMENPGVINLISSLFGEVTSGIIKDLKERQLFPKMKRTLSHGNLRLPNVMFKYKDLTPVECKLINFKRKLYRPPIYDVLQLIFFNTSEEFRQRHLENLLLYYHHCLEEELEKYGSNIDKILSYEQLQNQIKQFLPLIKLEVALLEENNETLEKLKETFDSIILSREDCYRIIRNKIGTSDYKLLCFNVTPLDKVNGYLGNYYKLNIKIYHKSEETIQCFVKSMPKNTSSLNIIKETGCFFKEIFIYETLIPQMHKLGLNTIDECLPACYFQRNEDVIVFDDLSLKNYQTLPSQIPFDFMLLSLTVKKLARFHASMIIFEEKKSEEMKMVYRLGNKYEKYLQEIFFTKEETHSGSVLMQTGVRSIVDVINLFPELKTELNQKNFQRFWPKLQDLFFTVTKPSKSYRNVLSHGDLWTNNIMVKFDGEEPVDCVFVDFQIIRYCPPAHDFLFVLYLTTDRATRMKHEDEMKFLYYEELKKTLESYNLKSCKILPFEEFVESIDYIRPQMIMQAIMYRSFCLCTSEEISSFLVSDEVSNYVFFQDRKEYLWKICQKSQVVSNALKEGILDLYDLCNNMSTVM